MKILSTTTGIIVGICLFFVLLFTAVQVVAYNASYYKWQYKRHEVMEATKMSLDDLVVVTDHMIDYLKGRRESLDMQATIAGQVREVFDQQDKEHMVDVQDLFVKGTYIRNICFILMVLLLGVLFYRHKKLFLNTLFMVKYVFACIIMLILILSALLLIDFNKYFTIFHEIFFNNDLWLLDPDTSILINMVPEVFFFQTAMIILGIFVMSVTIILVLIEVFKKRSVNYPSLRSFVK
ncbi:TIGR01906 family membrane protein [Vallitalea pronyensis]|uniref:TIGR01906 family membrane protein n=1 Tax=Vallitalea pronyensis TaxID=1348613 RepID=A0A8J8MKV6_9FIRM|nr:TIGR01906 family membrane protein [Vallitalea pronyensis]QUI23163.1 TIGR01906 family membrane protein [Vallitalea pronyensis]